MIPSPPQEAEHIRGKTLTPESPKPVHYPSPSNIPILEKQMDPMFNEHPLNLGLSVPSQPYPQIQTPSGHGTSLYAEQQTTPSYPHAGAQGAVGTVPAGYPQSTEYGGYGTQTQDTSSIHTLPSQKQAPASSFSEANPASYPDIRSAYPPSYDPNAYASQPTQAQPPAVQYQTQSTNDNYQALLDSLSSTTETATPAAHSQHTQQQGQLAGSSLPAAPGLPPRPPPQDKSATHANDDIRSYHPHSQKTPNAQFRGPGQLQPLNVRGGGSSSQDAQSATRSNQSPSTPGYGQRQSLDFQGELVDDEDSRWPPEINKRYEDFLEEERRYVTDGQWDQFPVGSRLFIGNLPTEKVTKRDIFHRFFRHGTLAQISIKQAYGFVQFLDASSAHAALKAEQGKTIRGRKMHLEISKPQRNTKKGDDRNGGAKRRSRSPDYTRGGTGSQSRGVDRYGGNQKAMSPRDRDNRRYRDEYRRSPSPQRGGRGMRGRDRSHDLYDGRRRSRSRSPRRYRSPSPRRDLDDDLPLPFRAPHQIPEIQVLVVDEGLPRDYIRWVEESFRQQGLRIDVLILSPRLSEAAVVRRQIVEGVLAIAKLNNATLSKGKVNLTVFDRRGGSGNVQFNEYADLDPVTAAALVINVKQTQSQPAPAPATAYGQGYGVPQAAPAPYANGAPPTNQFSGAAATSSTATSSAADLSGLLSSLDPSSLSRLLGAFAQSQASQASQASQTSQSSSAPLDLARLLGSLSTPQQPQNYAPSSHTSPQNTSSAFQASSLASLLGAQPPAQAVGAPVQAQPQVAPTGQVDMNEIMAQLAKYQR